MKLNRKDQWTDKEIEILKENWDKIEPHDLNSWKVLLPKRTYQSIKRRSRILNLKRDLSKFSKKKTFTCIICNKEFEGYGNRIMCSKKCNSKYMSMNRIGENNPYFNPNKFYISNCQQCKKEFMWTRGGTHKETEERLFCSINCVSLYYSKENHPNWKGGIQYYPYSEEFNKKLKLDILKRDNYNCKLCGNHNGLCVHHIDYDKLNSQESNLITVCRSCHGKTNFNRGFWEDVFTFLTNKYKIVQKTWGFEFIPINNDEYCFKALVFWENNSFSNHYHKIKKESWYVLRGKLIATLTYPEGNIEEFIFKKGDILDIGQGLCHKLKAIENTIILEVSTHHEDSDSYRVSQDNENLISYKEASDAILMAAGHSKTLKSLA
jgi:mannose-6-phosphate isomerase-like protein (cupin superfamily)